MEIKEVLVHTCSQNIEGVIPEDKKCRCRRLVSKSYAAELVEKGEAQYIIVDWREYNSVQTCPACGNTDFKRGCKFCLGEGEVTVRKFEVVNGSDIYMVCVCFGLRRRRTREYDTREQTTDVPQARGTRKNQHLR
jgi:hypothetical protein